MGGCIALPLIFQWLKIHLKSINYHVYFIKRWVFDRACAHVNLITQPLLDKHFKYMQISRAAHNLSRANIINPIRTGGRGVGIHPPPLPRFFALYSKNLEWTHTWTFLTFPNFWLRISLWIFCSTIFVWSLWQHFCDTQCTNIFIIFALIKIFLYKP